MTVDQTAILPPVFRTPMPATEPPLPTGREPLRPAMREDGPGTEVRACVEALTTRPRVYPGL